MWREKAKGTAILAKWERTDSKKKSAVLRGFQHQGRMLTLQKPFFSFTTFLDDGKADHAFQAARGFILFNN